MAQAGMPALSRLGFSGLWKASAHYSLNGMTFFQESAIKTFITLCLKTEVDHVLIWSNMLRYTHNNYFKEYTLATVHAAVLIDFFIYWEPVTFRAVVAPFEEYVQHSMFFPAYELAVPRILKADSTAIISLFVLGRQENVVVGRQFIRCVFNEFFMLWVTFVGQSSWTKARAQKKYVKSLRY